MENIITKPEELKLLKKDKLIEKVIELQNNLDKTKRNFKIVLDENTKLEANNVILKREVDELFELSRLLDMGARNFKTLILNFMTQSNPIINSFNESINWFDNNYGSDNMRHYIIKLLQEELSKKGIIDNDYKLDKNDDDDDDAIK